MTTLVVHEGVIRIQFNDVYKNVLMIPLENIEYIERVWFYLTFYMKSGRKHTIYVGTVKSCVNVPPLRLTHQRRKCFRTRVCRRGIV